MVNEVKPKSTLKSDNTVKISPQQKSDPKDNQILRPNISLEEGSSVIIKVRGRGFDFKYGSFQGNDPYFHTWNPE